MAEMTENKEVVGVGQGEEQPFGQVPSRTISIEKENPNSRKKYRNNRRKL